MSTFKQIQAHIDADAWQRLYDLTSNWVNRSRSQASICRYALCELRAETPVGGHVDALFPTGKLRVQVHSMSADEDADWNEIVDEYEGSSAITLRTALQFLYQSLSSSDAVTGESDAVFNGLAEMPLASML